MREDYYLLDKKKITVTPAGDERFDFSSLE
jgi:hypothetical protein